MKGLSPFVAAVLLICFTVAVGGIISIFLTKVFQTEIFPINTTNTTANETFANNYTSSIVVSTGNGILQYVKVPFNASVQAGKKYNITCVLQEVKGSK